MPQPTSICPLQWAHSLLPRISELEEPYKQHPVLFPHTYDKTEGKKIAQITHRVQDRADQKFSESLV